MIVEILNASEEPREEGARGEGVGIARGGWRRRALTAACPVLLGAAMAVDAHATATPPQPSSTSATMTPGAVPTPTPCPPPRMQPGTTTPQDPAPSVLLANHQPCNHHEGMMVAFRWR